MPVALPLKRIGCVIILAPTNVAQYGNVFGHISCSRVYLRRMAIHTATGEASRVYSISRQLHTRAYDWPQSAEHRYSIDNLQRVVTAYMSIAVDVVPVACYRTLSSFLSSSSPFHTHIPSALSIRVPRALEYVQSISISSFYMLSLIADSFSLRNFIRTSPHGTLSVQLSPVFR